MNWDFSVKAVPVNPSNYMVAAIYAASAPTVLVQSIQLPKPYVTGTAITATFLNIPAVVYNFILWESPDTTAAGGVLIPLTKFEPKEGQSIQFRDNLDLIADTTAGLTSGGTGYVDPTNSLAGWKYTVFEIGDGPKLQVDVSYDSNNNWSLTDGQTIQPGQRFVLMFQAKGTTAAAVSLISSIRRITDNQTLKTDDLNKQILLQGASASMIETLPALSGVADFQRIIIASQGGSHINASIRANGTDKIQRNVLVSKVVLGQNGSLELYKALGVWQVSYCSPDVDQVGQLLEGLYGSEINTLKLDGSLVSRATYERLWDKAQTINTFVSEVSWSGAPSAKGYFTPGDGTTNFRLPDLTQFGFRRATGIPGAFQAEMIGPHTHIEQVYHAAANGGDKPVGFSGTVGGLLSTANVPTLVNDGTENRPNSTGVYILIRC